MDFYEDEECQRAFVEENSIDFWDYCSMMHQSPKRKLYKDYCVFRMWAFLEFIEKYREELILDHVDLDNDWTKEDAV